ncbi:MAG TPA: hypothetical protein VJ984_04355 [Xanthomonadales bacterium]|nr:hypothetical protein [Xanthomonadales bacterium]
MSNKLDFWQCILISIVLAGASTTVLAQHSSKANAHYLWDPNAVVGQTTLDRSPEGLKASFKLNTNASYNGQVLTLWIVVFNTPQGCLTNPCGAADLENPEAAGDFLYGGGTITNDNKAEFAGSLATGDSSGSGWIEFGFPEFALGLTDPENAEVHLLLHSHGPASSGTDLGDQISSYFGGCTVFLGDAAGFALGPEDVPDEAGECSTTIVSIHMP